MLLNNQWVTEKTKENNFKYLETNERQIQYTEIYGMQQKHF